MGIGVYELSASPMLSAFDEQDSRGIRVASEPDHWRGTEPLRVLAPDGTAVGDTDVGLDPDELRATLRWMQKATRRSCWLRLLR